MRAPLDVMWNPILVAEIFDSDYSEDAENF